MRDSAVLWALVGSLGLHAALALLPVRPAPTPAARSAPAAAASTFPVDLWAGKTFEAPAFVGPGAPDPGQARAGAEPATNPEPGARPHPAPKRPAHTTSPAGTTPAGLAPTAAPGGGSGSGTYGAEGAADGVRDLLRSFVRALPPAVSPDPIWPRLPLGPGGSADVTLAVDEQGKVRLVEPPPDKPPIPPLFLAIVRRTLILLASGRFALDPRYASAGVESLRISVNVTAEQPPSDSVLRAGGAFGLGADAPTDARPGRAYFTLASGRHVDVTVQRLRPAR
jgi:hypothetical protein